jgi:hypothetical protein
VDPLHELLLRGPAWLLLFALLAAASGWARNRSQTLGLLIATGLVVRMAAGAVLFLVSLYGWPLFRSLQLGGGFWSLAIDGRTYFDLASRAATGVGSIAADAPSPTYLRVLAMWMWIFGVSVPSSIMLNITCYAASALAILAASNRVGRSRGHAGGVFVPIAAISFSPALLVFGTQPLKDSLCVMLTVLAVVGAGTWWACWRKRNEIDRRKALIGAALMATGVCGVAGIRAYAAAFMIPAFAVTGVYTALLVRSSEGLARIIVWHVAMLIVLCAVFMLGAGPYAGRYQLFMTSSLKAPRAATEAFDDARNQFIATGGGTATESAGADSASAIDRILRLVRGCAVLVVPISVDRLFELTTFSGGAGLLWVTDVDTIATDVVVLAAFVLVRRRMSGGVPPPSVVFASLVGLMMSASLAYVVTNYGTLFRLRALVLTPLWLLPALLPSGEQPIGGIDPRGFAGLQSLRDRWFRRMPS